jgi:hypothetical protein
MTQVDFWFVFLSIHVAIYCVFISKYTSAHHHVFFCMFIQSGYFCCVGVREKERARGGERQKVEAENYVNRVLFLGSIT